MWGGRSWENWGGAERACPPYGPTCGRTATGVSSESARTNALLPRIGLLSSRQVEVVMSGYLSLKEYRKNLSLLPDAQVADDHRVHVPRRSFDDLREMSMNILTRLNTAMESLS